MCGGESGMHVRGNMEGTSGGVLVPDGHPPAHRASSEKTPSRLLSNQKARGPRERHAQRRGAGGGIPCPRATRNSLGHPLSRRRIHLYARSGLAARSVHVGGSASHVAREEGSGPRLGEGLRDSSPVRLPYAEQSYGIRC